MHTEQSRDEDPSVDMGAMMRALWVRLPRILVVTLLLLAATYAILLFMPKMYESTAGILVEPRTNAYTRATNEQPASLSGNEVGVVSSQIELIKSRDTLLTVIDRENLRSVPEFNGTGDSSPLDFVFSLLGSGQGPKSIDNTVLNNLLERMSVAQERDSRVISIVVRSTDPELAARLANAIANAHVQRRAQLSLSDTAEASVWLEAEIEKLRLRVQEAESRVANFRVDNDLFEGPNNTSLLDQQLSNIATQITTAQERKSSAESRASLIRGLIERDQPIEGVPDVRESVVIQELSQAKATLQGERAQLMATLLPNHPNVQAIVAQIRELDRQIASEGRGVAAALDAQADIEAEQLASLQTELGRMKGTASTATRDTVQLEDLQREAKAQRDLLESYLLRYRDAVSRSESSSALPDVRVITLAAASVVPSSPKTTLVMLAVGILAIAVQVGTVFINELVSGRALRSRKVQWRRVSHRDDEMPEPAYTQDLEGETPPPLDASLALVSPVVPQVTVEAADHEQSPPPVPPREGEDPVAAAAMINALVNEAGQPVQAGFLGTAQGAVTETKIEPAYSMAEVTGSAGEPVTVGAMRPGPGGAATDLALGNLSADLSLGRVKIVMLASLDGQREASLVASQLVQDAIRRGLSIVRVDAGTWRPSTEMGLTDLSAGKASFGDVVHKTGTEGLAEVPWGHLPVLERRSSKPLTLVEALSDIYEVVIVLTGRIGMASSLPMFAGLDCRLVLVTGARADEAFVEAARADARALGFDVVQVVAAPEPQSEVA